MKSDRELTGLEGWLALVGIGLVFAPIRSLWAFIQTFPPLFRDGTWQALTEPDSVSYHPLWAPVLLGEIAFNIAIILASGYLLYLFFKKHFWFPRAFIVVLLAGLSFQLADAFVVRSIIPALPLFDEQSGPAFFGAFIYSAIWIPYMLVSRRVRLTFAKVNAEDAPREAA